MVRVSLPNIATFFPTATDSMRACQFVSACVYSISDLLASRIDPWFQQVDNNILNPTLVLDIESHKSKKIKVCTYSNF
jgi:hypothetical protein